MTLPTVVLVAPTPPPAGGIARWTSLLVAENSRSPRASLILVDSRRRFVPREGTSRGIRFITGVVEMSSLVMRTLYAMVRRRPDVLHLTTAASLGLIRDIMLLWVARKSQIATLLHLRFGRTPELVHSGGLEARLLLLACRLADVTVVLDRASEVALSTLGIRVERIANGIHPISEESLSIHGQHEPPFVLFLGWVVPAKGVGELVEAWRSIDAKGWKLVIAGPVDETFRTRLLGQLGSEPHVEFTGAISHEHAQMLMSTCSLFALPSHTEGFPNAVLEAMSMGKPIVATPVGAIPEMLADDAGVIVPVRNSESLSCALERLMDSRDLRITLGGRARARVESEYDFARVCDKYRSLWTELPKGRPRS